MLNLFKIKYIVILNLVNVYLHTKCRILDQTGLMNQSFFSD